jgi:putative colanic acid biosynthesis UDP-glucose lipid carrier transferase
METPSTYVPVRAELEAELLTDKELAIVLKRAMDVVLATVGLVTLAPILLLIALTIKLDSRGPVLYRQARHGLDGEVFSLIKFRTLRFATCDAPEGRFRQVTRDDPRVTRLGRPLRWTSLDELPQLVNVLRGEMSIVGPRPHPIALNDHYAGKIDRYLERHAVKPGITGWAQVNGLRGETDTLNKMERRVRHDLYYVEKWSLGLDIRIIFRTLLFGFIDGGVRSHGL